MTSRHHSTTGSSSAWNSNNGRPPAAQSGNTQPFARPFVQAARQPPTAAAAAKAASVAEVAKSQYENILAYSKRCLVQRFLAGDMDEVTEELPFRLQLMEKREFIEELGVDELAFAMRVEQLQHLERLENSRKKKEKKEQEQVRAYYGRARNYHNRPRKTTHASHAGVRNHNRREHARNKYRDDEVACYQFQYLPDDATVDHYSNNDVLSGHIVEENQPSAQERATDSLRRRMQEGLIIFELNDDRDRKTTSAQVLHLMNSRKNNKSSIYSDRVLVHTKTDLLVDEKDRLQFLEQRRKQEERRNAKEKSVEDKLARARLKAAEKGTGGNIQDFVKIKPDEYDYIPFDYADVDKSSTVGAADPVGDADDGFETITVGKKRIRARKIRIPETIRAQYRSNRRASERAKKLMYEINDEDDDEDGRDSNDDDKADEELLSSDDEPDYTGQRDLEEFYMKRYGVNLTGKERVYNVFMGKLFELRPDDVKNGTPLLLRKATLKDYSDDQIKRDISCGLFPGGVPVICEPDQDISELKRLVYTEYIQFEEHSKKLVPRKMPCSCGICDCRCGSDADKQSGKPSGCNGCACKKDRCKCGVEKKCPHKEAFRFDCKRQKGTKRCIFNIRTARHNNYLAPSDGDKEFPGKVDWRAILSDARDDKGYDETVDNEDVSAQLYEFLVVACGPQCACACAEKSPIGYGPNPALAGFFELRMTKACGWGVFAKEFIKKGTYLFEYAGQVLGSTYIETRKRQSHYVFDVPIADEMVEGMGGEEILCLDAIDYGNLSRFVNHSCSDNCIARRVFIGHSHAAMSRLVYFARRDILPGEELTLDYQWDWWVHMYQKEGMTCRCGEPKCQYTAELMPGLLKMHAADRNYDLEASNSSDDDELPVAEREAKAAAKAVNAIHAAAQEQEEAGYLDTSAFEQLLGISEPGQNVIRRDLTKTRYKYDEDAHEISVMNANARTRQAKKNTERTRRDMRMMTMTEVPENLGEIVLPEQNGGADQLGVHAIADDLWMDDTADDIMPIDTVPTVSETVEPSPVAVVAAAQQGAIIVPEMQHEVGNSAPAVSVSNPAVVAPAVVGETDQTKDEVKEEPTPVVAPVASSSTAAPAASAQRSLVEQVFAQSARINTGTLFQQNIMNILNRTVPIRDHLNNLVENLCASASRISVANAAYDEYDDDDKKEEKKEEKQEPRSVFMDGSPSAMAMMIGNDEDDDDKMKTEPIPVEIGGAENADASFEVEQIEIIDAVPQ